MASVSLIVGAVCVLDKILEGLFSPSGSLAGTLRRGASLRHEPRPYVSRNPIKEEDLDVILNWESDKSSECWQKIKSVREGDVWKKEIEDNKTWVMKVGDISSLTLFMGGCSRPRGGTFIH